MPFYSSVLIMSSRFLNINYEMLKKDYYRKRKRNNIEKSLPQTVPGFFRI